jgi:gamma-glutamyl-gamma-aminobutyrate hydrolase PuuD
MKKIAVSQRLDIVPEYGERRDTLDVRWAKLLETMGIVPLAMPSGLRSPIDWLDAVNADGIILTGGNDLAIVNDSPESQLRDELESKAIIWGLERGKPLFGVCRGAQALAHHFGAEIVMADGHVGNRHRLHLTQEGRQEIPSYSERTVNSYHGFGIQVLPDPLVTLAVSEDGLVEAFRHKTLPLWGILWHPERETSLCDADRTIIENVFT